MNKIYLVFGIQGSGKGTQARLLAKHKNLAYFEAGQELRNIAKEESDLGEKISKIMQEGSLVDNSILKSLFVNFLDKNSRFEGLVIDGFPRNETQAGLLEELANEYKWKVTIIHILLDKKIALQRLLNRKSVINGKAVKRPDDEPGTIEKRFGVYFDHTVPMLKNMEKLYTTVHINGEPSIEEVAQSINDAVK